MLENYKFYKNKTHPKFVYNTLNPVGNDDLCRRFAIGELIFFVLNNNCIDDYGTNYAKILVDGIPGYIEIVSSRPHEFESAP